MRFLTPSFRSVALLAALGVLGSLGCGRHARSVASKVVMAWEAFPLSLDPRLGQDQASQRLLSLTHQGLLRRDEGLVLVPDACQAWRWETPFTVLSFDFPKAEAARFFFAPGRPLTAWDALDAIEALRDPSLGSPKAGPYREEIQSVEVRAEDGCDRLRIRLKVSSPGFASNLARGSLGIAPAGLRGERLPGTGPYVLESVVPEQSILLRARIGHPDFRARSGQPQDLELRLMPDANTRLLALRHGSAQVALNNLPADLLTPGQGFEVFRRPGANMDYVIFQCQHPRLRDPRVRLALSLALDRPALMQGLFGGMAREAWGFFPPELPQGMDVRQELSIPVSTAERLQRAEALLDAAGFPKDAQGQRFSLQLSSTPEVASRLKALAFQAQWARIGVRIEILSREFGTLFGEVSQGRFELASLRWTGASDPEMLVRIFRSSNIPPEGFNRGRFADAEVDRLLDASHQTSSPEARLALLRRVQVRIVQQAPYAFLWWPDQVAALAPGLEIDLNPVGDFSGVWRREERR